MPGLSYPFVYECSGCDRETTVTREDARNLCPDPDSLIALIKVLEQQGWTLDTAQDFFCPECTDAAEDAEPGPRLRGD